MNVIAQTTKPATDVDVVVVGAGFAGLYMLYQIRKLGLSAQLFEAGDGVGGTWYWNRYPGARCDVESLQYSFSFSEELQQEWEWSERYSPQSEILRYLDHVADRFDLRRDIALSTRVTAATFDEATNRWRVETDTGRSVTARYCIMATGCLSASRTPDFKGLEDFKGVWHHTGRWPHQKVDFAGKRVAVVGTGSSGIQAVPVIAEQAAHLYVFQRTPNFSIPAWNMPLAAETQKEFKAQYAEHRETARKSRSGILYQYGVKSALEADEAERREMYEARWARGGPNFVHAYNDLVISEAANQTAADFVRDKIRSIVSDPVVAGKLTPTDHPIGTKRICVDTDFYATFNRDNVELIDVRNAPIERVTPTGIQTSEARYDVDMIVFATGYDAVTGALAQIDITGKSGQKLVDKWTGGPRSYLGLMMNGFPNLLVITGPGSPSILTNVVVSIEQHVEWITEFLHYLETHNIATVEPKLDAEDAWVAHVNEVAERTLFPKANSWYMGANIPGKPRVFLPYVGGLGTYTEICDSIAAKGYDTFTKKPAVAELIVD